MSKARKPRHRQPRWNTEPLYLYEQIMAWDPRRVEIMEVLMQTILFMFELVCALAQF